jgi:NAD(P)-dependent dehydrogenase (short-subunit alcohol dehydrogenase family)
LMADVRRVADEITARHPKIHVLINNAGVLQQHREENTEGREITWAINHLGPFLLTNLLLDAIKAAAPARIITVSSIAHRRGQINFEDLESRKSFGMWPVYSQSKLANILFTRELAKRLEGTGVTANTLHPGIIATQLFNRLPMMGLLHPLIRLLISTPKQGAQTSIYLASSPQVDGVTGKYFAKSTPTPTTASARDMDVAARLWSVSEQMTGLAI